MASYFGIQNTFTNVFRFAINFNGGWRVQFRVEFRVMGSSMEVWKTR